MISTLNHTLNESRKNKLKTRKRKQNKNETMNRKKFNDKNPKKRYQKSWGFAYGLYANENINPPIPRRTACHYDLKPNAKSTRCVVCDGETTHLDTPCRKHETRVLGCLADGTQCGPGFAACRNRMETRKHPTLVEISTKHGRLNSG